MIVVAISNQGYWGRGTDLDAALCALKQAGGKTKGREVEINIVTVDTNESEKVYVMMMGNVSYPRGCTCVNHGKYRKGMTLNHSAQV